MMYRRMTVKQLEELAAKNKTLSEAKQPENTTLHDVLNEMLKLTKDKESDRP